MRSLLAHRGWRGTLGGHAKLAEALAKPRHPERREFLEWIGGAFDPERSDAREVNLALHGGWVRIEPDTFTLNANE